MRLRVLSIAEWEAAEAALWYEDRRAGLGNEFLDEVEHAFSRIRENREQFSRLEYYRGPNHVHRVVLDRFPYLVIYACRRDETLVVAVSHARRRPLYWLDRLGTEAGEAKPE